MNIVAKQITGRPGPNMAIEIAASFEWFRQEPAFFLGLSGQALFGDKVIGNNVQFQKTYWGNSDQMSIARGSNPHQGKLIIPISGEAIRFIEENRRDQDVPLNVNLQYTWQELIQAPTNNKGEMRTFAGSVHNDSVTVQECVIKRSDWLKRLAEMKWQEFELFEVAKQPLIHDQNLAIALKRLEEAQIALRGGDYSGVLTKCRAAFESAAKYESNGDTQKGFESLLARAFKDDEKKKQETMNSVIKGISEYAHLGRHEQYPTLRIGREEAEFIFCTTASTFSIISRLLAHEA